MNSVNAPISSVFAPAPALGQPPQASDIAKTATPDTAQASASASAIAPEWVGYCSSCFQDSLFIGTKCHYCGCSC